MNSAEKAADLKSQSKPAFTGWAPWDTHTGQRGGFTAAHSVAYSCELMLDVHIRTPGGQMHRGWRSDGTAAAGSLCIQSTLSNC